MENSSTQQVLKLQAEDLVLIKPYQKGKSLLVGIYSICNVYNYKCTKQFQKILMEIMQIEFIRILPFVVHKPIVIIIIININYFQQTSLFCFRSDLGSQHNGMEDTEISHIISVPLMHSLSHYQCPPQSGTFVTMDDPTLTHHYRPKSIANINFCT